jgi:hypothetical protein
MMRFRHILAAVALSSLAVATAPVATARSADRVAAGPNGQAVVVIGNSTHVVQVGGGISGIAALRAVASVETLNYGGSLGEAVCKINGVGDPAVPSSCPGGWRYYRAQNGAGGWTYSGAGPSNTTVRGGDVEGWGYNSTPPFRSFSSVAQCAPPPPPPGQGGPTPGGAFPPSGRTGGGGTNGGAAPGTPGAPGAPGETVPGDPTATTAAPDTTATDGKGGCKGDGDGDGGSSSRAARTRLASDDSSGPGSPLSFIVFGVVLVLLVAGVFTARWFRRRAALATGGPSEPTKPPDAAP